MTGIAEAMRVSSQNKRSRALQGIWRCDCLFVKKWQFSFLTNSTKKWRAFPGLHQNSLRICVRCLSLLESMDFQLTLRTFGFLFHI